jgi:hypothetical protein
MATHKGIGVAIAADKNYIKFMYKSDEKIAWLRVCAALSNAGMRALVAGSFVQGIAARRSRPLPIPTSGGRS